jgi:hypothetical protein
MEQLVTRIGIEPGLGLVGRFGDTVILIPRGEAATRPDEAAQELLGLAAEVGSDRQAPANAIASRLAAWVIGHMTGDAPAFGIVAPMRDGVVMFLRGAVWCTITEGGSTREVSGEQALTWVDLIVPGTFGQLAIGAAAGRPVQADPLSDLRAGVVPGQGFALSRTADIPGPETALADSGAAPADSGAPLADSGAPLADSGAPLADSGAAPADSGAAPADPWASSPGSDAVSASGPESAAAASGPGGPGGFAWPPSEETPAQAADWPQEDRLQEDRLQEDRPADDRPQEAWALRAEAQNHQPTMIVRTGEHEQERPSPAVQPTTVAPALSRPTATQPPLGVLTSEDGPPIVLEGVHVLGREPQQDPAVESGEATPVQLQDPDHVISRVHAYVSVENGIVLVRDAGSMHGTYFSPPGGQEWTRIGTEPSPLPPGWSLQIGPQVFTFELAEPGNKR